MYASRICISRLPSVVSGAKQVLRRKSCTATVDLYCSNTSESEEETKIRKPEDYSSAFHKGSHMELPEEFSQQMNLDPKGSNDTNGSVAGQQNQRPRRPFCKRCNKAASLCICTQIKTVIDNQVGITILQHPEEKNHHLGSARIAALSLRNIEVISIPEVEGSISYRIRGKVPGSKRSFAGRVGKKGWSKVVRNEKEVFAEQRGESILSPRTPTLTVESSQLVRKELEIEDVAASVVEEDSTRNSWDRTGVSLGKSSGNGGDAQSKGDEESVDPYVVPAWISLPQGVGLLFPSEKAVDLLPVSLDVGSSLLASQQGNVEGTVNSKETEEKGDCKRMERPTHLIVLDGTWSKAKRIYFEHPWLHSLPHYRLPLSSPSMYGYVRRQPRPGCLSTVESIVFALRLLEPQTKGLESLLEVFDSMIMIAKKFQEEKEKRYCDRKASTV